MVEAEDQVVPLIELCWKHNLHLLSEIWIAGMVQHSSAGRCREQSTWSAAHTLNRKLVMLFQRDIVTLTLKGMAATSSESLISTKQAIFLA